MTGQSPTTTFPLSFSTSLDDRYRELLSTNIPLRLDWYTFVAPFPLFGQYLDSNRLQIRALNQLQYRPDNHKDKQEYNIQIPTKDNLTLNLKKL